MVIREEQRFPGYEAGEEPPIPTPQGRQVLINCQETGKVLCIVEQGQASEGSRAWWRKTRTGSSGVGTLS